MYGPPLCRKQKVSMTGETVADASHLLYRFKYAPFHYATYDWYLMTAVVDGRGRMLLQNLYRDSQPARISSTQTGRLTHRTSFSKVRSTVNERCFA